MEKFWLRFQRLMNIYPLRLNKTTNRLTSKNVSDSIRIKKIWIAHAYTLWTLTTTSHINENVFVELIVWRACIGERSCCPLPLLCSAEQEIEQLDFAVSILCALSDTLKLDFGVSCSLLLLMLVSFLLFGCQIQYSHLWVFSVISLYRGINHSTPSLYFRMDSTLQGNPLLQRT